MKNAVFSNGHALLIGVGTDLPVTRQDAIALRDLLIDPNRAAYPSQQVELLIEADASRESILDAFDRLNVSVRQNADATVMIYFSGHGGRIEYPNASPEYFLIPYGYDPNRRTNTTISSAEFTDRIRAIQARKLIVILDCCHAGGIPALKEPGAAFVNSPLPPELLEVLQKGSGQVVIASSNEGEYSYTSIGYSVFTACLLEALEGKAAVNKDGFARILDVLIYLFKHVPERASGPQHPIVKKILELGDNFPLCYYAGGDKHMFGETPFAEPHEIVSTTKGRLYRLDAKYRAFEHEWNLRGEKIRRMRAALAIETSVTVKFQLEQQILDEEAALARCGDELSEIEKLLKGL